jgi:hypothetical protein
MYIKRFKQFQQTIVETRKDDELNKILDKVNKLGINKLTDYEKDFLKNMDMVKDTDLQSFSHLDFNDVKIKLSDLLSRDKKVKAEFKDADGYITNIEGDTLTINGVPHILKDNYFYGLVYNNGEYTLTIQDEFFVPIEVKGKDVEE